MLTCVSNSRQTSDSRHYWNRHFGTVDIMGIDILGIDIMGVDMLGIDILALPNPYIGTCYNIYCLYTL